MLNRTFALLTLALLVAAPRLLMAQAGGFYYQVRTPESLYEVSRRLGVSAPELSRANRLRLDTRLKAGTRVWVPRGIPAAAPAPRPAARPAPSKFVEVPERPSSGGSTHTVRSGESLWTIAQRHGLSSSELARINGIDPSRPLHVGQRLRIVEPREVPGGGLDVPDARPSSPAPSTPARSTSSLRPSSKGYIWPVEGRLIRRFRKSSEEMYTGIDIAVPRGTEVRAARDGKVVYAGSGVPGYGSVVIIEHDSRFATVYAHNDRVMVSNGQRVSGGQVIARSGDGGKASEAALHFELRRDGTAINPEPYLP